MYLRPRRGRRTQFMERAQILIVEDEGIVAEDLSQHLQRLGYRVPVVVASGPEAIQQAVATHPDLVMMDIRLRGPMDGVDAAAQIRSQVDIPVVYLTAHADQATLERAKVTEPYGYILKPFDEREVAVTIEMALYKHKMEKALEQQRADFVAMLTHDIKNPLSVILGYAELLTEEVRAHGLSQAEDLLGKLQSNALSVHSLV